MDMTGEAEIAAPREQVYQALNDPEILRQSIPGCEAIEKLSDTEMSARVTTKVGPVKATFNGQVTLSDLNPPESYTISGEGKGGTAGFASGSAKVSLEPNGAGTTLRYEVKVKVGGKLAQLGGRLISGTAKKLTEQFFENFGALVGGEATAAAAPVAEAAPAAKDILAFRFLWVGGLIALAVIVAVIFLGG